MAKLRVFISSSMNLEPDAPSINWLEIRSSIRDALEATGIYETFIIEDHASPDPSNEYMLTEVRACDVFVLILGTVLRNGTEQEYREAFDKAKPQLVYELNLHHDDRCLDLIHKIHDEDRCTTRKVEPDKELGPAILEDLKEYVVGRFKGAPTLPVNSQHDTTASDLRLSREIPLPLFGKSNTILVERLGRPSIQQGSFPPNPYLSPLGEASVDWLLDNTPFSPEDFSDTLPSALGIDANSADGVALRSRWKACHAYMQSDRAAAVRILEEAQKNSGTASRLHIGILIDLRNLYSGLGNHQKHDDIQSEIDNAMVGLTYQPYGIGHLEAARRLMQVAQDDEQNKSEKTIIYGDRGLAKTMAELSGYLFCSISYGSITGLDIARGDVAKALMRFARILCDGELYVKGLRLLALSDYSRDLREWMDAAEGFADAEIVAHASDLWNTAHDRTGRLTCCGIHLFEKLGPYLDDGTFRSACDALLKTVTNADFALWHQAGDAMAANAHRMDVDTIANMVQALGEARQTPHVSWLIKTLLEARIEDAGPDATERLARTLQNGSSILIEHGLEPSVFAVLARRSESFRSLARHVGGMIGDDDRLEFEANLIGKPTTDLYASAIRGASTQLQLVCGGIHYTASGDYARGLASLLNPTDYLPLRENVEPLLLDLFDSASKSSAEVADVDPIVACAIKLAAMYRSSGIKLPKRLKSLSKGLEGRDVPRALSAEGYEGMTWSLRIETLKQVCDKGKKHDMIRLMGEIPWSGLRTRIACAECLEAYLTSRLGESSRLQDEAALMNIALMLGRDSLPEVRSGAIRCAMLLATSRSSQDASAFLRQMTKDPNPTVRLTLLYDGERLLGDNKLLRELAQFLSNDAHYRVRTKALRCLTARGR